jgi:hypothetical protein
VGGWEIVDIGGLKLDYNFETTRNSDHDARKANSQVEKRQKLLMFNGFTKCESCPEEHRLQM